MNIELKTENNKIFFKDTNVGLIDEKGIIYVDHKLVKDIIIDMIKEESLC